MQREFLEYCVESLSAIQVWLSLFTNIIAIEEMVLYRRVNLYLIDEQATANDPLLGIQSLK